MIGEDYDGILIFTLDVWKCVRLVFLTFHTVFRNAYFFSKCLIKLLNSECNINIFLVIPLF